MMRIAEFIAGRKAWQIFAALVGPLVAAQIVLLGEMQATVAAPGRPSIEEFDSLFRMTTLLGFLLAVLLLTWFVAIALVSNRQIDVPLRPSMRWYVAAAIYAPAYFLLAGFVFFPQAFESKDSLPAIVVLLHFAATAAMFYVLGFTAKNLIMAERQTSATFFDYSGPIFLLWFFPIGVWFVQPRVNGLLARSGHRI